MAELATDKKHKRKPLTAVILSLIMPGLGHVYCGKIVRGLILAFLSSICIPVIFGTLSVSHSSVRIAVIIVALIASLVVWLVAVIDSWYTAKHTSADYILKDYNRWYVYIILILMGTGGSTQITFNVKANLVEAFRVPVASNYPTIVPNDRILANKLAYKNSDPKRGDLIVFLNPDDRRINYIKRVVAIAGDTVEVKDGQLYVNDQKLRRQMLPKSTLDNIRIKVRGELLQGDVFEEINGDAKYKIFLAGAPHDETSTDFAKITIPKHHCFVLGDNRNLSRDSRHFGPVPLATIKGRADYLYFPAKGWSRFGRINS
ncbi:MAG: signal peptidase I [Planctomycetota bacterium]|jgi:signal peptidase I